MCATFDPVVPWIGERYAVRYWYGDKVFQRIAPTYAVILEEIDRVKHLDLSTLEEKIWDRPTEEDLRLIEIRQRIGAHPAIGHSADGTGVGVL